MRTRKCVRCKNNRRLSRYVGTRGRICDTCRKKGRYDSNRARRIQATYGITITEYNAILAFQRGVCAGCGEPRRYALHVDHDHEVERQSGSRRSVRGLLCKGCNKLLRDARDNAERLRRLADYLDNPPARSVLGP